MAKRLNLDGSAFVVASDGHGVINYFYVLVSVTSNYVVINYLNKKLVLNSFII